MVATCTPALFSNSSEYPRAEPHIGSNATFKPALRITSRSTISASRFRYAGFGSSDPRAGDSPVAGLPPGALSPATISASIFLVTSGSAGQPSGVENLMPLYSGGLCEAVKLMTPSALLEITAWANAGVGAGSATTSGVIPFVAKISAALAQNVSPRNRGSRPTITRAPCGFCDATYRAIPPTARRTLAMVNSSAITARQPDVPNLICVSIVPTPQENGTLSLDQPRRAESRR